MDWVETTGKTVEEAKDSALDQLGVDEHDAEFDILEQPKIGLFGRLRAEARVRARVKPTSPRPKDDRRDRRRRGRPVGPESAGPETAGSGGNGQDATPVARVPGAPVAGRPADRPPTSGRAVRPTAGTKGRQSSDNAGQLEAAAAITSARGATSERTGAEAHGGTLPRRRDQEGDSNVQVDLGEQGRMAREFLEGLLEQFGLSARLALSQPDDETVELKLDGEGLGILIGPKAATLLALQDLTRTVVQRRTGAANGRIQVDVAGYRQKRTEALIRFSEKVAADVQASGQPVPLEPMSAADRRIVHDAVSKIGGVTTTSEGEDASRHVVILPVGG